MYCEKGGRILFHSANIPSLSPERRKGTVSDRRGAGRGMSYRKTSWISGPETAGGAFAGMSGTAAASAEIKAEGTGGKETYVPLSGGGSRDFCDSDSGLVIYGEDSDGCQFIV